MPPANENSVFGFSGKFNCGFLGKDDDSCCGTALGSFGGYSGTGYCRSQAKTYFKMGLPALAQMRF